MNPSASPERPNSPSRFKKPWKVATKVTKPLAFEDGPMVWIDCEMTGLDFKTDKLLEIAVIITNGNLDIVHEGIEYIIQTDKHTLDNMNEWCVKQHGQTGLTAACLASPHTLADVSSSVLSYVKEWIPGHRTAVLAGSSVHADRAFLAEYMPELVEHLHYRIVDVSSIKELCRRWYPEVATLQVRHRPTGSSKHRALDDIQASIEELRFYRKHLFLLPGTLAPEADISTDLKSQNERLNGV